MTQPSGIAITASVRLAGRWVSGTGGTAGPRSRCSRLCWRCTRLPPVPVADLIERPAVGWVTQTDQVRAEVAVGKPEHAPRLLLVGHRGVTGADAEIGGGQHDVRRRLPEVVHEQVLAASVLRLPDDEGDRRCGPGNVLRPLPDLR